MKNSKLGQMTAEERVKAKEKSKENFAILEKEFLDVGAKTEIAFYKNIPMRFRNSWLKCRMKKTTNKSTFIKLKCEECNAFEDLTEGIGNCKTTICPLWSIRPKNYIASYMKNELGF